MRDFSWNYFCNTGHINAYLLYKEHENLIQKKEIDGRIDGEDDNQGI